MNKVILMGNLGADPDVRQTQSGQSVAELRVATSEKFKDKDGKQQDRTEWHRVVVWGANADNAGKYLRKGSKVLVEGSIRTREWTDKEGQKRYVTEVVCQGLTFLDPKGGGGGGSSRQDGGSSDFGGSSFADDSPF